LVFVPGVITGFNLACHCVAVPNGGVLMQSPAYPPILQAPEQAGMLRQEVELIREKSGVDELNPPTWRYRVDYQAFEATINDQTRLFILCNPHNPIGKVFTREELEGMAEICLRHRIPICSDEIHCDLIYPGHKHIPIASLDAEIAQNTITLMSPSKTFNLAGLKFSFAIIQNPELRKKYQQSGKGLVSAVNLMGWVAGLAAYREGQEWLQQLLLYLEANRDFVYEYIQREMPAVSMGKPEGTYLAWLDCRRTAIKENPYEFFLHKARVALNDGKTFGLGGEGFVRLNFGCPRSVLKEALERMKAALVSI